MENFDGDAPVISCPSSPGPAEEIYQGLVVESIHCAMEEQEDNDTSSPPLVRSASSPDRIFANHNFSGHHHHHHHHHDNGFDDRSTSTITPPPTSPEPSPSPPPAPPTGIRQSEMRAPSPDKMYHNMIADLDVMMDIARNMHELARHTKSVLHTAYERVDLSDPCVRNLGIAGVLKDLRQESAHSVVDGQRAQLRYEKVMADVRRLRRCLRNLGFWRVGGAGRSTAPPHQHPPSPPPLPETSWGLPHQSYFSNDF